MLDFVLICQGYRGLSDNDFNNIVNNANIKTSLLTDTKTHSKAYRYEQTTARTVLS